MHRNTLKEIRLKPGSALGSGRVRQFTFSRSRMRVTQITTFCPDVVGPGPTNLYLVEGEALVLLDTGIPTHLAKAFFYQWRNQPMPPAVESLSADHSERELLDGLALAGYSVPDINLVVISHGHPDHFFMTGALARRGTFTVSAHILDTPAISNPWALISMWLSRQPQIAGCGMPTPPRAWERVAEALDGGSGAEPGFSVQVDRPVFRDGPLKLGGSILPGIEVVHLPGHTSGSIGLLVGEEPGEKLLLCGDVLLYPITPHPDDLLVYLQTLRQLKEYSDVALVLPAHGKAVRDLRARVDFLQEHHKRRLRVTFEACHKPRSVWDIASMPNYFNTYVDRKEFNFLAGTEALVHMEVLTMVGALERACIKEQVHYFQKSGEPFEKVYGRIMDLVEDGGVRPIMRY